MHHEQKKWLRLAVAIHAAARSHPDLPKAVALPAANWAMCQTTVRRIETARQRGWQLAAARLEREFRTQALELRDELDALCARHNEPHPIHGFAKVRDIYHDLLALLDEFEEVACDRKARTLSVTTEPIELAGIYLGPFEICLPWDKLGGETLPGYRVNAVDPHPAASHDGVTHPHVQDEVVCEGDGRTPLRAALAQGRLLDFFLIVAGILRTYNGGSPYVALEDWYGFDCADCGCRVSADDRWSCESCGESLCDECRVTCPGCDCIFCCGCTTCCAECDDYYCSGCLPTQQCDKVIRCQDCLDESRKEPDVDEEERPQSDSATATIQPDGVGQAVVSA